MLNGFLKDASFDPQSNFKSDFHAKNPIAFAFVSAKDSSHVIYFLLCLLPGSSDMPAVSVMESRSNLNKC